MLEALDKSELVEEKYQWIIVLVKKSKEQLRC